MRIDVTSAAEIARARAAFPLVVADDEVAGLREHYRAQGCTVAVVDPRDPASEPVTDLVSTLGGPEWTGTSWDALWDVFEELREEWTDPVILLVRGVDAALALHPHRTLNTVLFLTQFAEEMTREGPVVLPVLTEVGA